MYRPNLKSVALPVAEIIGGTLILWTVPGYAHAPFYPKLLMGFCSDGPCECTANFEGRSFTRSWDNGGYLETSGSPWIHHSRSSKVNDFGTNRKHIYDFLLVHDSNLGPILHRFGNIAGFLCSWVAPPLFHPNFGGVPSCTRSPMLGTAQVEALSIWPWNYFRSIPTCENHTSTSQTDVQIDRQTTYCGALRGKSISAVGKVMLKIKAASFFWDTV